MDEVHSQTELKITESIGKIPEIKIENAILYHGSGTSGIKNLKIAGETTVGKGVYLTSDLESAKGYASLRAKRDKDNKPVVYEIEVTNLTLADLRGRQSVEMFSQALRDRLVGELKRPNLTWLQEGAIRKTLDKIKSGSYKSLKDLTWNHQDITTEVLKTQGFDGLVTLEGGEGEEVQEHDSYVIFDPQKIKVQSESFGE